MSCKQALIGHFAMLKIGPVLLVQLPHDPQDTYWARLLEAVHPLAAQLTKCGGQRWLARNPGTSTRNTVDDQSAITR